MMTRLLYGALGWAVPGLGHFVKGERRKGVLFAATLLGCFAAGEIMSDFRAVSTEEHEIAFWAQVGMGLPTLACVYYDKHFNDSTDSNKPTSVPPLLDCGIMYTCVSGLLSMVLVVDLLFPVHKTKQPPEDET